MVDVFILKGEQVITKHDLENERLLWEESLARVEKLIQEFAAENISLHDKITDLEECHEIYITKLTSFHNRLTTFDKRIYEQRIEFLRGLGEQARNQIEFNARLRSLEGMEKG